MEVTVTSMATVKPAGIGQEPLKKPYYNLCLLGQLMNSFYVSFVFFYPTRRTYHHHHHQVSENLKSSLSETLNTFYALAGRVRDNLFVDRFDAGVPFVEARVGGQTLGQFLAPPRLQLLNDLVPFEPLCLPATPNGPYDDGDGLGLPLVAVQMNTFDCGGIAIGISVHHKMVDGGTADAFLNTWSANSSSNHSEPTTAAVAPAMWLPELNRGSSVFPSQASIHPVNATDELYFQSHRRTATRRFVFDEEAIEALKRRAASGEVENPTQYEALSAFVWESALRALHADDGDNGRLQSIAQAVNLRNRMGERLDRNSVGNLIVSAIGFRSRRRPLR